MKRIKLAIISTHPIQYYAPVFRALTQSQQVTPKVFFTWSQTAEGPVFDPGFGTRFSWDVPLLDGYDHVFVPNVAKRPGSNHFRGVQNPQLTEMITSWGADAVLVFAWNMQSHLRALRYFKGRIPVLFRGDSTLLNRRSALRTLARRIVLRWVYSHVDVAIAVGQNNRDYYAWSGLTSRQLAYAPHSVDTRRFGDAGGSCEERAWQWRADLGIPPETTVFVFAAKFQPLKEPLLLLDAFLELETNAHLILIGNGEMETALRDRASGHANVHFLPFQNQSEMPTAYRLGDVYVLPSNSETWGLAMNEAMACGRAVIASSLVGGARDLVQTGITGWIFESGDRNDLKRILRQALCAGGDELRRMGERAKAMSEQWSSEAAARSIADVAVRICAA